MGVNMKANINNIDVNYEEYGNKKGKTLILLHGWGQNIEMMKPIGDNLQKDYHILIVDFPGFGQSEEPKEEYFVDDYCKIVESLVEKLNIKNPSLIGHSFGGRVSIVYASRNPVDKLVLFGSPCIRYKQKDGLKVKALKTAKKVPGLNKLEGWAKKHIGSRDYKAASESMRKTFVNVINEDLSEYAKKITAPTLLVWGDNDLEEPVENSKDLEKIMKDAARVVLPNSSHYAYLENLGQVLNIIREFI